MHLAFHPVLWWPIIALGGAALAAAVVWIYRGTFGPQAGRWRGVAFVFRVVTLLMALAALLRPELVFTKSLPQSARLLVLYDQSRSMQVADAWDGLPRWRAMEQTVERSREALDRLGELLEIRKYSFDSQLHDSVNLSEPPTGASTAIGDVLREAIQRSPGRVAGVVIVTDGASRTGTPPTSEAQHFKDLGVPIYTVGIGQEAAVDSSRDLAFRTITAGPTVFEKNRLSVVGELDSRGFAGSKVTVNLLFDGMNAEQRTIELPAGDGRTKVEMSYVPTVPGEHKVSLEVREPEPKKGELVESNNEISTFVTVLKGGLRVLYLDGGLEAFEPRFIRWSLDKSPDIKVDFAWVRDKDAIAAAERAGTLFDRSLYDVFLIRDIPRNWFSDQSLERLRKSVETGAGLAMLGGQRSFGPGGYAKSPVEILLPVTIHPGDQQIQRPLAVRPTNQGLAHFIMRLGSPQETPKIWESLHPLDGATGFTDVKGQASVLAETPDGTTPLIVAQDFGQGRSMAIAGDSTRHWYRQSEQGMRHHRRFWRQVILWLAKKEQSGENRVWVDLGRRRVGLRESLDVTAGAEDEQGNPLADAEFEIMITPPGGPATPLRVAPQGERMKGVFYATDAAGEYQVSVIARHKGQELAAPRVAKFLVFEDDAELTNPAADLSLLEQMAKITQGESVPPERLPSFLDSLQQKDLHLEIDRLTQVRLWDNPWFFLIFVALLTGEWAIRKRNGLV